MTTNNELHQGDTVRIVGPYELNPHRGKIGTIEYIGVHQGRVRTLLYLVDIPTVGLTVYERDEIERVESEVEG